MTTDDIRTTVLELLCEVAPEIDPAAVKPDVEIRDQFDLDSMDILNFVISVDERFGVEIPESDYGRLTTIDGFVDYLGARLGVSTGG
jgi:acyl carrier protein